jgi:Tol biopolymer transport system component
LPLTPGSRLGPYEILAPLGAGGMGEVYRARDSRLGREVAIKVLPADLAGNKERLRRFEREARSVSALNHPNIVTVYDIGASDGVSWIAMERVEGETLRALLGLGPFPLKRLLTCAAQIAEGLAKAHAAGIVHRDLKPENVMVTKDGLVKILDFGLAKLTGQSPDSTELTQSPTVSAGTEAGVVLGTVGYMSPEQARGESLDFPSDQFSFGSILYEMTSGKRAFARGSSPETMAAVIREEPEPLSAAAPGTPVPLRWIVERCLAKDPEERYASTRDLARDLIRLRDGLSAGSLSGSTAAGTVAPHRIRRGLALLAVALAVGAAIVVVATRRPREAPPLYRPVTFQRGSLGIARFAPDGNTILYSASWQGRPTQLYSTRLDGIESTSLPLPSAGLLSVSSTGKLAVLIGHAGGHAAIAEVALAGGAPRELVESELPEGTAFARTVADWLPGEDRLAIVRNTQLEFPVGKVLVPGSASTGVLEARFSPDGRQIAFVEGEDQQMAIGVVDRAGKKRILSTGWEFILSLAWHPGTGEIWFSARSKSVSIGVLGLHAVSLSGDHRVVARTPQMLIIEDIARDGRVLARSDDWPMTMMCMPPGASREVELSWLDFSSGVALSDDGQDLLFTEGGAGAGGKGATYVRKTDGSTAAVRLGEGENAVALSQDKKWVIQLLPDRLVLLPVGPGESKTILDKGYQYQQAAWFPDGERLLIGAVTPGHGPRLYVRDIAAGPPRPLTPEETFGGHLSPDGKLVVALDTKSEQRVVYPVEGGEPRRVSGVSREETILGFDSRAESLFLVRDSVPLRIDRLNLATGERSRFKEISVADPTGVSTFGTVQLTPDGKCYCYSFLRSLSRLYVVEGFR